MSSRYLNRQRNRHHPLNFPCPVCGANVGWSCLTLRAGADRMFVQRVHPGRGLTPHQLELFGFVQRTDGLWRKPRRRRRAARLDANPQPATRR